MTRLTTSALILYFVLCAQASAREWHEESIAAPAWSIQVEASVGCSGGAIIGSATAGGWADECQVSFVMPTPEYGGPWLIEYVAVFISGTESREIILRSAADPASAPGAEVARPTSFTPAVGEWPATDWTYIQLQTEGCEWPDYLLVNEGEVFTVGFPLLAGDRVALAPNQTGIGGWSYYGDEWINDTDDWNMTVAVRISIADTGLRPIDQATWGVIKNLFN